MIEFIESPNRSGRQGSPIISIIGHFTAGGNFDDTVRYLCNRTKAPAGMTNGVVEIDGQKYYDAKASAHYVTSRPEHGVVRTVQLVREEDAAWHAGSKTTTPMLNGKKSVNLWSIGHEICNWGALRKIGQDFYCWPSNWSYRYTGPTPVNKPKYYEFIKTDKSYHDAQNRPAFPDGVVEWWEPYSEETIKQVIGLWKSIAARHSIGREWIAGHETVDPTRKLDPGPLWDWDFILNEVYGKPTQDSTSVVQPSEVPQSDRSSKSSIFSCLLGR